MLAKLNTGPGHESKGYGFMTTNYNNLSYEDLKNAFDGAKNNDSAAMNQLYYWFRPLICSIANKYSFYTVLKEDAENIAWVCFYGFVKSYQGNDYYHIPGLIKKRLISRLTDAISSHKYYDPNSLPSSESAEYLEASYCFDSIIENLFLKEALSKLTPFRQKLIYLIYFEELTYAKTAAILNIKERSVRYQHSLTIKQLRKLCLDILN